MKWFVTVLLTIGLTCAAMAQSPPRRVQAQQSRFSIDTPIASLIAHPAAKAALDRHLPRLSGHPRLSEFRHLTVRALAASPHAAIPASRVQALQADLVRIR